MLAATFADEEIPLDAVLLAAVADGTWDALRAVVERGVAAEAAGRAPEPEALRAAEAAFRRARTLLSADDLRAWLGARDVTIADWRAHMARTLMGEDVGVAAGDDLAEALRVAVAVEDLVPRAARGLLLGAAAGPPAPEADQGAPQALAARAAADAALPLGNRDPDAIAAHAGAVLRLRGQLDRARAEVDQAQLAAAIAARRLDWTEFVYDEIAVGAEPAAREAVLCVRVDGEDLATVGARAGCGVERRRVAAGVAGEAASHLAAGAPGDVLGPVRDGDVWRVLVLHERRAPDPADPDVASRARDLVLEESLDRRLAGRVRWHVPV